MKKYALLILCTLLMACQTDKAQPTDQVDAISDSQLSSVGLAIKQQFSPLLIVIALDQIAPMDVFEEARVQGDHSQFVQIADSFLNQSPNTLNQLLDNVAKRGSNEVVSKKLYTWCQIYTSLKMLEQLDAPVFLEELLYDMPVGRKIVETYLTSELQDWGSLSSSQLNELPYLAANFLIEMSEYERTAFLQEFYQKVNAKISKD